MTLRVPSQRIAALALLGIFAATSQAGAQATFPGAWAGKWSGTLRTYAPPDSVRNTIPVTLEIQRESDGKAYLWRTIFNADTMRGIRPYRLVIENAAKGLYATDESNGVLLDETFIAGVLTSVFQVGTRFISNRYAVHGDTLTQELLWWESAPTRTVKGSGANAEGGAEILSYRVLGLQRAMMTRVRASQAGRQSNRPRRRVPR
jgi:hypothetical protein